MTARSFIFSHRNCRRFLAATHHAAILNNYAHDLQVLHFTVERGHDVYHLLEITQDMGLDRPRRVVNPLHHPLWPKRLPLNRLESVPVMLPGADAPINLRDMPIISAIVNHVDGSGAISELGHEKVMCWWRSGIQDAPPAMRLWRRNGRTDRPTPETLVADGRLSGTWCRSSAHKSPASALILRTRRMSRKPCERQMHADAMTLRSEIRAVNSLTQL